MRRGARPARQAGITEAFDVQIEYSGGPDMTLDRQLDQISDRLGGQLLGSGCFLATGARDRSYGFDSKQDALCAARRMRGLRKGLRAAVRGTLDL